MAHATGVSKELSAFADQFILALFYKKVKCFFVKKFRKIAEKGHSFPSYFIASFLTGKLVYTCPGLGRILRTLASSDTVTIS